MRRRSTVIAASVLLLLAATALLAALNYARLSSSFEQRSRDRHAITLRHAVETIEGQLALGLPFSDTPALQSVLAGPGRHDPAVTSVVALDSRGVPIAAAGEIDPALFAEAIARPLRAGMATARADGRAVVAVPVRNAFDVRAGWLAMGYGLDDARERTSRAFHVLWLAGAVAAAVGIALLLAMSRWLVPVEENGTARAHPRRLTVTLTVLVLAVQVAFAAGAWQAFVRIAQDDAPGLAATLARTLDPTLQRALTNGIPLAGLRGADDWLNGALAAGPEFTTLALRDAAGAVLFSTQRAASGEAPLGFATPIEGAGGESIGSLEVGLDARRVADRTQQLAVEFLTLLFASALVINEFVRLIATAPARVAVAGAATPVPDAGALRAPLFLFFIGAEVHRSFLPIWATEVAARPFPRGWSDWLPDAWLEALAAIPPEVLGTVPISAFLLTLALTSTIAGRASARHGPSRVIALGLALAGVSHLVAAFADTLLAVLLARILAGAAFGVVTIAALDWIGRLGGGKATGMAVYLTAYVSAGIAGSGIGALLFDRSGPLPVFMVGLACCVVAGLLLRTLPDADRGSAAPPAPAGTVRRLLRAPEFRWMIVLVALPLQFLQQGLLFYWIPLALGSLGASTVLVGPAMMAYFAMVLLFNRPLARYADRTGSHDGMLVAGLALAALSGAVASASFGQAGIAVSALGIGLAWALAYPSLGAVALRIARARLPDVQPIVSVSVYRTIERVGAMATPLVFALLITAVGHAGTAAVMAAILGLSAAAYWAMSRRSTE